MSWFTTASGKHGRNRGFSNAIIQFCLALNNLLGLTLKKVSRLVVEGIQLYDLAWPEPNFITFGKHQLGLDAQIPYTRSKAGLQFLVDSGGIKFLGEDEWKCKKHVPERRRQ